MASDAEGGGVAETARDGDHLSSAATVQADSDQEAYAKTMTPASDGSQPFAATSNAPGAVDLSATTLDDVSFGGRYSDDKRLGRGGMGEVRLYKDERMGRDVAMKYMRDTSASPESVARFLREARVQGQLEHPAIVPVYDLGVRPDGTPYFTMKRLRGKTLERIIKDEADGHVDPTHTHRKLLGDFVNVCLAIEFAHSRGVLHRDLKPGNIMLGDFGEVYVLDWGIAKISGQEDTAASSTSMPAISADVVDTDQTAAGAVLGTPGYMAPEQLRGEVEHVDERSDVYSLGAILFEVLTLLPLHERSSTQSLVESTLGGADAHAAQRAPLREVPPELEDICLKATATEAAERYQSVRDLQGDISRYLDGDRDLARRRELAEQHAAAANAAAEDALSSSDPGNAARSRALREASTALALDPNNRDAIGTMTRLMLEPPTETPPEATQAIAENVAAASRLEARNGALLYAAWVFAVPLYVWMGVRSWWTAGVLVALIVFMGVWAYWASLQRTPPKAALIGAAVFNALFLMLCSRAFGPFILIPGLAMIATIGFIYHTELNRPFLIVMLGCASVVVPVLLEVLDVIPQSYAFENNAMIVLPQFTDLPATATKVTLTACTVALIVGAAFFVLSARNAQHEAERQLQLQSWHLRQLVPEDAREAVAPPPPAELDATCRVNGVLGRVTGSAGASGPDPADERSAQ
jgi:serine/threonine-protein kinase